MVLSILLPPKERGPSKQSMRWCRLQVKCEEFAIVCVVQKINKQFYYVSCNNSDYSSLHAHHLYSLISLWIGSYLRKSLCVWLHSVKSILELFGQLLKGPPHTLSQCALPNKLGFVRSSETYHVNRDRYYVSSILMCSRPIPSSLHMNSAWTSWN